MNKIFLGLIWSGVPETTISRPGVAFRFSHVNITVTDYAMAMFFLKRKYPLFTIFMFKICFYHFFRDFRNVRLKSVTFM